jgi:hypothetical protein
MCRTWSYVQAGRVGCDFGICGILAVDREYQLHSIVAAASKHDSVPWDESRTECHPELHSGTGSRLHARSNVHWRLLSDWCGALEWSFGWIMCIPGPAKYVLFCACFVRCSLFTAFMVVVLQRQHGHSSPLPFTVPSIVRSLTGCALPRLGMHVQ